MSFALKVACCVGIMLALTVGAQAAPLSLKGILVFGGDSTGLLGTGGWNTVCQGGVAQLGITGHGTCPLSPLDISTPQTYTFDYFPAVAGSVGDRYADLELFFNGETYMPGIHVIIDRQAGSNPPISAASSTTQQCVFYNSFDASCSTPPVGPSSLTYSSGGLTVTALHFTANSDWNGQIQFSVASLTGVPEPGTFSLLGAGCLALLAFVRRRR
jgi:hypothetical protein